MRDKIKDFFYLILCICFVLTGLQHLIETREFYRNGYSDLNTLSRIAGWWAFNLGFFAFRKILPESGIYKKNIFPGIRFPPFFIKGLAIILIASSLYCVITHRSWSPFADREIGGMDEYIMEIIYLAIGIILFVFRNKVISYLEDILSRSNKSR